ncbi:MAG: DUF1834 family protein [Burkholderiales bacterium]|nr:DUF1834 family protein [Burkholderiales bacterium]
MAIETTLPYTNPLVAIEVAMLARVRQVVGPAVRHVGTLPGVWDDQLFKTLANRQALPGVYLGFERATAQGGTSALKYLGEWSLVVAVGNAAGEDARKTGDATSIGAYALLAALASGLADQDMAGQGSVVCGEVANLWSGTVQSQGLAVYSLALQVPFSVDKGQGADLAVFATFSPRLDMPQHNTADYAAWLDGDYSNSNPEARDEVLVPQDALVLSAVYDQVHYWAASKAQLAMATNVREGAALLQCVPELVALGVQGVSLAIEADWYRKWGADGLGCPALVEELDANGAPIAVSDTPAQYMLDLEDALAESGLVCVRQTIGAAAGYQAEHYAKPAIHRTATDVEASSSLLGRWQAAAKHDPRGAYTITAENEPLHTLAGVKRGLEVGGQPAYPGEKPADFQVRAAAQRTVAAQDLAQIYLHLHGSAAAPAYTRRGFGSFLYGDFRADKQADDEDDGGTDSSGRLGFAACVDELDAVLLTNPALPAPGEVLLNSYSGKWPAQLDGVVTKLSTRAWPAVLGQYAPAMQKKGPVGDGSIDATPVQIAVAQLSDLAAMLERPDLARVHRSYLLGAARAVLDKQVDGSLARTPVWHTLDWWANRLPTRRVPLYGALDAAAAAGQPGVHAVAGLSARRAAVLMWNDGSEPGLVQLHEVALPGGLAAAAPQAWELVGDQLEPQPLELVDLGGMQQLVVQPWSAVLVERVLAGDEPLQRRACLANGTGQAWVVGIPAPFVSRARPSDYARYDVARHVAHMGLRGAGRVGVGLVLKDAPDSLWCSAGLTGGSGMAGQMGVLATYLDAAGATLGQAALWTTATAGLVPGATQALAVAASAPVGWTAAGRVVQLEIWMQDSGPNSVGTVYLGGSSDVAAAPWI